MRPAIKRCTVLLASVGLAVTTALTAAWPANAQPTGNTTATSAQATLQQQVDGILRAMPGARQISQNQVAIDDTTFMTITLPGTPVGTQAVGDCRSLFICI